MDASPIKSLGFILGLLIGSALLAAGLILPLAVLMSS